MPRRLTASSEFHSFLSQAERSETMRNLAEESLDAIASPKTTPDGFS